MKNRILIYRDNGNIFLGEQEKQNINYYKTLRRYTYKEKYIYKGWKRTQQGTISVLVFSHEKWDYLELLRRKRNGFLGIRKY